jgi:hypothetical protein
MAGITIPLITEFKDKGIKQAMKEFKALETTGKKAQFALKKAALPAIAALALWLSPLVKRWQLVKLSQLLTPVFYRLISRWACLVQALKSDGPPHKTCRRNGDGYRYRQPRY